MSCKSTSYTLNTSPLSIFPNIFFHSESRLVTFLMVSFKVQKILILMKSYLSIFPFVAFAVGIISNPRSWRFTPMFSSKSFIVLALTFKPLIHSVSFYTWHEVKVQLHSFACGYSVVPAQFVEKTIFPPLNCLGILWKINWSQMCGFISGLSIPFHWSVCLSLCRYHTVLITVTF